MNEFLNTGLNFLEIAGLILATALSIALAVIAVKVTIKFDVNKHIEHKHKLMKTKLMNACTHVLMRLGADGQPDISSRFIPINPQQAQCVRCMLIVPYIPSEIEILVREYASDYNRWFKEEDQYKKLLKKSGQI